MSFYVISCLTFEFVVQNKIQIYGITVTAKYMYTTLVWTWIINTVNHAYNEVPDMGNFTSL